MQFYDDTGLSKEDGEEVVRLYRSSFACLENMSQKYPEGAVITKGGGKFVVVGCSGEVRFVGEEDGSYSFTATVRGLEKYGWTVEEAPWKPEERQAYSFIDSEGRESMKSWYGDAFDERMLSIGNCYPLGPGSQALKDAQARVLKAYRG